MRRTRSLAWCLAGLGGLLGSLGCGQLWRPFLQATEPAPCAPGDPCAEDLGVPADLGPSGPWEIIPTNTTYALRAIWGYDSEQTVFLGGDAGTLLSWRPTVGVQPEPRPLQPKVEVIHALSGWNLATAPGPVVAAGTPNVLLYYSGALWKDISPSSPVGTVLTSVTLTQPSFLFAAGDQGALYAGTLGGTLAVARIGPGMVGMLSGVAPADPSRAWVTLATGEIFLADSSGNASRYLELTGRRLNGIWAGKPMSLPLDMGSLSYPFVVGTSDTLAHFDGKSFQLEPLPPSLIARDLSAACGNSKGEVWVVGRRGLVLYFDGAQWSELSTGIDVDLLGAWVAPGSSRPWLVADGGLLLHLLPPRTGG